ncbi:MAG: protein-L-isoaspartate(D-aspartate) O-methyltransferase [Nanoarchaeota archaeon]|nr:protein-L-isoaspartate(D-aspartate) O-methyltransferase [Nanoarchaeota archaeon]
MVEHWESLGLIKNKKIIEAFLKVPREKFILPEHREEAYADIPLPIIEEQTISQPTTVVMMLDFLDVKEDSKVLEIGAGSGYNAALLSKLTKNKIISVERIKKLADFARENLKTAGIENVEVTHGDGSKGYPKEAPYDRIIATCGSEKIPEAWKDQLKEGGLLVAPIGTVEQEMIVAIKVKGELKIEKKGAFRFVPLLKGKKK